VVPVKCNLLAVVKAAEWESSKVMVYHHLHLVWQLLAVVKDTKGMCHDRYFSPSYIHVLLNMD
jgi:hypothetical protein